MFSFHFPHGNAGLLFQIHSANGGTAATLTREFEDSKSENNARQYSNVCIAVVGCTDPAQIARLATSESGHCSVTPNGGPAVEGLRQLYWDWLLEGFRGMGGRRFKYP